MHRLCLPGVLLAALLLAGCGDPRRELAREHLRTQAPPGFTVVAVPDNLPIREESVESAELITLVRYRTTAPTIELRDGFALPAARAVDARFADLRGWALSSLPADAPLRAKFLAAIADAHRPFPVKRVVTPAGTEVEAVTTLSFQREANGWLVSALKSDATVPGQPDADPSVPFEDAAEVSARVAELTSIADQLDATRREYLAARKVAAERSVAQLRSLMKAGRTFIATLATGKDIRLVITRGLESTEPAVIVVTVRGAEDSTARFGGTLEPTASGEMVWQSTQIATLTRPADGLAPAITDAARHPVLRLRAEGGKLSATFTADGQPPQTLDLHPSGAVELLPEISSQ